MKIRFIFYTFLLLLSFNSCSDSEINPDDNGGTKGNGDGKTRTVLAYMVASNLGGNLSGNLAAMQVAATKANLNGGHLVVFYSESKDKATLFEIQATDTSAVRTVIHEYTGESGVSPETMQAVIDEVVDLYPADSYGLILSSHGSAWMPANYSSMLRAFGEESGKWMEIDELASALPDGMFDFILFDACSMGAIECAYELKDKADYIVASPSEILSVGFPYTMVLPYLFTAEANLEQVAKGFYNFFNTYAYPIGNIAVADTKELDALATITHEILYGKEDSILALDLSDVQLLSLLPNSPVGLYDFGDVVKQFATADQYQQFQLALTKAVLYPYYTKQMLASNNYYSVTTFSGLSVYPFRPQYTELNDWYKTHLAWYQAVFE